MLIMIIGSPESHRLYAGYAELRLRCRVLSLEANDPQPASNPAFEPRPLHPCDVIVDWLQVWPNPNAPSDSVLAETCCRCCPLSGELITSANCMIRQRWLQS